jgi:hypothetical protein
LIPIFPELIIFPEFTMSPLLVIPEGLIACACIKELLKSNNSKERKILFTFWRLAIGEANS